MIAELEGTYGKCKVELSGKPPTKVRSFPSQLRGDEDSYSKGIKDDGSLTLSRHPDQGAVLFPFFEFIASSEPGACLFVVSVTCGLVICRWVWRAKQFLDVFVT
jgi:hypothetical protein